MLLVRYRVTFRHWTGCLAEFKTSNFDVGVWEPEDLRLNLSEKKRPGRDSRRSRLAIHCDVDTDTHGLMCCVLLTWKEVSIQSPHVSFHSGRPFQCQIVYRLALHHTLRNNTEALVASDALMALQEIVTESRHTGNPLY